MTETEQTLSVIEAVFAAFDNHDLDRFSQLLTDDAELNVGGTEQTVSGIEAIVSTVGLTLVAIPDLRVTVVNAFAYGAQGVAEVVREGTHTGTLALPDGTEVLPTEQPVRLPECAVFRVHDGKVARMSVYTDQLDTFQQLGILPQEGEL